MGRVMALDWGSKRIGIALSDPMHILATPHSTLPAKPFDRLFAALQSLVDQEDVEKVIVGLPRNMDGTEGASARAAREFAERLSALGIPVEMFDERLSSFEAERRLRESGRQPSREKARVDRAAAALLLQDYLGHGST